MSSRPFTSGLSTSTWRSKRPGRSRAGSSTSGRLVAPMMMTPLRESKPSISARSWFSVCSRSSWLPTGLCTRALPSASSSSMNTMQGALASACWNRSRMRAAPTPTNISTNSEPLIEKKGTWASPATARASSVLPVPGGPTSSTPFGIRPPRLVYFFGVFRNSTTSRSSSRASSTPATSTNRVFTSSSAKTLALLRANDMTPPSAPFMRRKKKPQMPTKKSSGSSQPSSSGSQRLFVSPLYFTPRASSSSVSFGSSTRVVVKSLVWRLPLCTGVLSVPRIAVSPTKTSVTPPLFTNSLNSL